jgi:hypothetical protein
VGQSQICYVCSIKSRLDPALSSRVVRGPKWLGANPSRATLGCEVEEMDMNLAVSRMFVVHGRATMGHLLSLIPHSGWSERPCNLSREMMTIEPKKTNQTLIGPRLTYSELSLYQHSTGARFMKRLRASPTAPLKFST